MKRPVAYIIVGLLFFVAFSEVGWAAGNYISPATVPPSTRREGLVRTPDAVGGSGNLLITGNIRGSRYFRGVVPYSAPTDFGVTLPSSSLDPFLRDSVGVEDITRQNRYAGYTLGYRPYYSPTQTAASSMSTVSAARAPATNIGPSSARAYFTGTLPVRRDEILDTTSAISLARLRPMSMTPAEMQKLISSEIAKYSPARLTDQQYQPLTEQYKPEIGKEAYKTAELKKPLLGLDGSLLPSVPRRPISDVNRPFGIPTQKEQAGEETAETPFGVPWVVDMNKPPDVYDQMKQQLDILQKKIEMAMAEQPTGKAVVPAEDETGEKPAKEQMQKDLGPLSRRSRAERLAETGLSTAVPKGVLGPYETFASFSEDKFNQSMRAAELYLKQGRYYRAADAYTLASLYKPNDPLAYAGKSHALFASGEYMSSALFLSRALQIFPEYARFKIDLVAMVGNRDKLESRVVDLEEWLDRSGGAPELQFLLAYVYYQMGRPSPAKEAIDAACEKMPDSSAVLVLKKVIEDSWTANEDSSQRITDNAEPLPNWPREKK
jgi:tetratricopeptide (TPR) repeat protein